MPRSGLFLSSATKFVWRCRCCFALKSLFNKACQLSCDVPNFQRDLPNPRSNLAGLSRQPLTCQSVKLYLLNYPLKLRCNSTTTMTTHQPRGPYSEQELSKLYPNSLKLQLVQILLRHGERSPVSARFQSAGLAPFWPYCSVARQLVNVTMASNSRHFGALEWRRRLETFGTEDGPVIASGPEGEVDSICNLGELTDVGRQTTHALGVRLRHLYVDQLHYMPAMISDADMIYLRATPIPRALESLQETFSGLYPLKHRSASFPPPTIISRAVSDETLYPNDSNCRRFAQLSRAIAQRTADRWNKSDEMAYLNKLIGHWMPDGHTVAVDSHPRLSGIMDTINSTLGHGPETRLPREFYDTKGREIIDRIGVEEWFSGYKESTEYRSLGIGALMGDLVERMVGSVERNGNDGLIETGGKDGESGVEGRGGEKDIKLALSGCHDTTLAAILTSLGAFDGEKWPPYTSHVALELFRKADMERLPPPSKVEIERTRLVSEEAVPKARQGWFAWLTGDSKKITDEKGDVDRPLGIARKQIDELSEEEKSKLDGYFVRVRYNDKPVTVPGCRLPGNHLEGDESFCTLVSPLLRSPWFTLGDRKRDSGVGLTYKQEAFKSIVDKYTPKNWKQGCRSNLDATALPTNVEPAGY
jgi:acid phosphatase